jgi:iron(III) transport system substrate-binding protein
MNQLPVFFLATILFTLTPSPAMAAEKALNIYSARHYQTDEALYRNFTEETGIKINRIEGKDLELIERLKNEAAHSPADVLITVDAGNLWIADQAGLFHPVRSKVLESRIPANLRHPDGHWFGFSTRARGIVYNKDRVNPSQIQTYEDLADPRWKGRICMRASGNIYNLSLMSSIIERLGEQRALEWAKGVVANFARDPKGGDTDQIKAVAAGECDLTLGNSYYFVRLMKSDKPDDRAVAQKVRMIWPNQASPGTHINISGAGVMKHAPHKEAAIRFLEYLASDEAQQYFADGNNEYPVVEGLLNNPELAALGKFKIDPINVSVYGKNQPLAQKLYDRAGWR